MLETEHGEVIDAARADLWASGLGQDDARSAAFTQRFPRSGWTRMSGRPQLGMDVWDDELRVRLERQLWAPDAAAPRPHGQSVILEWGHWARVERDEKRKEEPGLWE